MLNPLKTSPEYTQAGVQIHEKFNRLKDEGACEWFVQRRL